MKIKIILTNIFFCALSTICFSQSFYEFKWKSNEVNYKAFLIYNNDDHMIVRVGYTNNLTGAYKVAEYNCIREEYTNKLGQKVVKYDGTNAKIVHTSNDDNYGYDADNFYFIDVDKNNKFKDLYADDDKENPITNTEVDYRKLNPDTDLTENYLNQFYAKNDKTYVALINNKSIIDTNTDVISRITFIAIGDAFTKLSKPAKQDIQTFDKFLKTVTRNMKIEYRKFIYNDEYNFNKSQSVDKIKNISISNDEVVILLYRGHGFRWADQLSNYPRMKLGDEFSYDSYNFETLHKNLASKNPRLIISIGDMCNSVEGISPIVSSSNDPLSQDLALSRFSLEKMAKLLLKKGTILTVSAKPGEKSYSSHDYGFYSKSFMDALQWEISDFNNKTDASWYNILNDASRKAKEISLSKKQVYQNALFQVNLN